MYLYGSKGVLADPPPAEGVCGLREQIGLNPHHSRVERQSQKSIPTTSHVVNGSDPTARRKI